MGIVGQQYDSISMAGCGMLNFYQVGVYKAISTKSEYPRQ